MQKGQRDQGDGGLVGVTFSFLFAPQPPSSPPHRSSVALITFPLTPKDSSAPYRPCLLLAPASPSLPLALICVPRLSAPTPSLLIPFPILPPTLLNTEPPRSMNLPWISPGSPRLPTDTHLWVSPKLPFSRLLCFTFVSAPLLLSHLILLLSLIPCTTISFFSR